jgi:hypothetical protein
VKPGITLGWLALPGCVLLGCDDGVLRAFEPSVSIGGAGAAGSGSEAGGGRGGITVIPVAGAGQDPTLPLLIDDFEDGDTRARAPLGWWYPINDETGTQGFGIEPVNGDAESVYALRTHGSGFQSWGAAVGVNLIGEAGAPDLRSYQQLCFEARVEAAGSTAIEVHFLRAESHYIHQLSLTDQWSRHCVRLVDFVGLSGMPLVPDQLQALQFFFAPGSPFAFWLDDVEVTPGN